MDQPDAVAHKGPLLLDGGNVSFRCFDALAESVGSHAALVLVELAHQARPTRTGSLEVRTSERYLSADLQRWGALFSRGKVRSALELLSGAGLAWVSGHGRYEIANWLLAGPSGSQPAHHSGSQTGPEAPVLVSPGPHLVLVANQDPAHEKPHVDDDSIKSCPEAAVAVVALARSHGVAGVCLTWVEAEPARALAWLEHAVRSPAVEKVAPYLNRMLNPQLPRPEWPRGVDPSSHVVVGQDGLPVLVAPDGSRSSGPSPALPPATPAEIDARLATETESGVPLVATAEFQSALARRLAQRDEAERVTTRGLYRANFEALQDMGFLLDRAAPYSDPPRVVAAASGLR